MALTKTQRKALDDALEHLRTYLEPDNAGCGISTEARIKSRPYLQTWVLGPLEALEKYDDGDKYALDYLKR